jgi:protein-tyrosine-phosphatase
MSKREKHFPYKSILVVCSVNTARSPMAVGFLKKILIENEMQNIEVFSGGISSHARDGMLISLDSKLVMEEMGIQLPDDYLSIDLKKHRNFIQRADLILTLTEQHKKEIRKFKESNEKKIFTLKEFAGEIGDIKDPNMKGLEGFRLARDEIYKYLDAGIKKFIT